MTSVHDIAAVILTRQGPMTSMKLQKLAYYSQAWCLALHGKPAFDEEIQAWANGPVVYELFDRHRGKFVVGSDDIQAATSPAPETLDVIDRVLKYYGPKSAQELSDLTHHESPWQEARRGLPEGARSRAVISQASLQTFYEQQPQLP